MVLSAFYMGLFGDVATIFPGVSTPLFPLRWEAQKMAFVIT